MAWFGLIKDSPPLSIKELIDGAGASFVPTITPANGDSTTQTANQQTFIPADEKGGMLFHPYGKNGSALPVLDSKQLAALYVANAAFWAAVQQLTKPTQAARLILRERTNGQWQPNDEHEIIRWWRSGVNPEMSGSTLAVARIVHLAVYGVFRAEWTPEGVDAPDARNAQGVAISGNSGEPAWLTPCNPDILRPDVRKNIATDSRGRVSMPPTNEHGKLYRYVHLAEVQGQKGYPVEISDVYSETNYNPQRGYAGIAPLALISEILGMGENLVRHARQYLGNNALPSGLFTYSYDSSKGDAPEVPQKERSRFVDEFMRLFSLNGTRPSSPAFLPGNVDFKPLTPELEKLMPLDLWDIVQAIVHEVLGTSAVDSLVGLRHVKNTGAGTKSHQTSVWRYTIEPQLSLFAENLGAFLFQKFDEGADYERWQNGDIEFTWDFSRVPAWREIQEEHNKTIVGAWSKNAPVSANEVRAALGLQALEDERGLKMPYEVNAKQDVQAMQGNGNPTD